MTSLDSFSCRSTLRAGNQSFTIFSLEKLQAQTGSLVRRPPNMETVRLGRQALKDTLPALGQLAERNGFLACRDVTLADLSLAAHLSALDYFGEIPWTENLPLTEWYTRMKSRPSFRPLLADRVPGQPPVSHYAELDF